MLISYSGTLFADCPSLGIIVCGYKEKIEPKKLKNHNEYCVFSLSKLSETSKKILKEKRRGLILDSLIAVCNDLPKTENFYFDYMCSEYQDAKDAEFSSDYYLIGRGVQFGKVLGNRCKGVKDFSVLID